MGCGLDFGMVLGWCYILGFLWDGFESACEWFGDRLGSPFFLCVFTSLQRVIRKFADGWFEGIGKSLVPW